MNLSKCTFNNCTFTITDNSEQGAMKLLTETEKNTHQRTMATIEGVMKIVSTAAESFVAKKAAQSKPQPAPTVVRSKKKPARRKSVVAKKAAPRKK